MATTKKNKCRVKYGSSLSKIGSEKRNYPARRVSDRNVLAICMLWINAPQAITETRNIPVVQSPSIGHG
jgi:hypothetical protein